MEHETLLSVGSLAALPFSSLAYRLDSDLFEVYNVTIHTEKHLCGFRPSAVLFHFSSSFLLKLSIKTIFSFAAFLSSVEQVFTYGLMTKRSLRFL